MSSSPEESDGETSDAFPLRMRELLVECGLTQQQVCKFSKDVVQLYSTEALSLKSLSRTTLSDVLAGKRTRYKRPQIITFYLACRYADWLQQDRQGPQPALADAFDFYRLCVQSSREARTESPVQVNGMGEVEEYDQFDLEQRRVMSLFGFSGIGLLKKSLGRDPGATLRIAILYMLAGRASEGRRWLMEATELGVGRAARILAAEGSPEAQELAIETALELAKIDGLEGDMAGILYLEYAAQNKSMHAAYMLGDICEKLGENSKAIRYFAEAEALGHQAARGRISSVRPQLEDGNSDSQGR